MPYKVIYSDSLSHHGILGQKWGVRRYQNEDGTWTAAGKKRYSKGLNDNLQKAKNFNDAVQVAKTAITDRTDLSPQLNKVNSAYSKWSDSYDAVLDLEKKYGKADYYLSSQYRKDMNKAYDDCVKYYRDEEPEYFNEIVRKNGGSTKNLDKYHDFRKMLEAMEDDANEKGEKRYYEDRKELKQAIDERDKAKSQWNKECGNYVNSLLGKYASQPLTGYSKDRYQNADTTSQAVRKALDELSQKEK